MQHAWGQPVVLCPIALRLEHVQIAHSDAHASAGLCVHSREQHEKSFSNS